MDVKLRLTCRIHKQEAFIEYWLSNHSNRPLLAYDGAPGIPPGSDWPDLNGQIYVSAANGQVELKRINPPVPAGEMVTHVFIPPVSQVMPGEERNVRFRLALPLVERSQYTPDFPGAHYQDHVAQSIQLTIGYFWKGPTTELRAFPDNPVAFRVVGPHGDQAYTSARCAAEVPVRVRVDDQFQRL